MTVIRLYEDKYKREFQKQFFTGSKVVRNILIEAYKMGCTPGTIFAEFAKLERDGVDLAAHQRKCERFTVQDFAEGCVWCSDVQLLSSFLAAIKSKIVIVLSTIVCESHVWLRKELQDKLARARRTSQDPEHIHRWQRWLDPNAAYFIVRDAVSAEREPQREGSGAAGSAPHPSMGATKNWRSG